MSMLLAIAITFALFALSFVPVLLADPKTPRGARYSLRLGCYLLTGWMPGKKDQRPDALLGEDERIAFTAFLLGWHERGVWADDPQRGQS